MHINIMFLTSISNDAYHGTISIVHDMKCILLEYKFRKVFRSYIIRGFNIILILVDKQFKSLKE